MYPLPCLPDPGLGGGVTCIQVLQQGPKGHGVDLWAETARRKGQNCSPAQTPCCPSATPSQGGTHQWVPEDHNALALPFGVQHVGKVSAACTQDAAMGLERFPMHHEDHIAVNALIQKSGKGQMDRDSAEDLSSV